LLAKHVPPTKQRHRVGAAAQCTHDRLPNDIYTNAPEAGYPEIPPLF
jgi:hypothetical protein